nr:integrase, catalytic region, zinc finger, CCHC-type, peptidase aspartic, catalytic [Tanacetum cinerariifolium]
MQDMVEMVTGMQRDKTRIKHLMQEMDQLRIMKRTNVVNDAESNLNDEENDCMLDNSFGDETLEDLTATIIMIAHIQPGDNNDVTEPNYDARTVRCWKAKGKGGYLSVCWLTKESAAFRIYNKQTRKIHESVNVNFDEISEMASKQFSLKLGLSNLNKTGKSSNLSVSQVDEYSKKDLEDLFQDFYDEYFDSSKIMKSSTMNVETPINEEAFHEVSELFQGESSSSSSNDDVQQSPEEVILPSLNTQSIPINVIPIGDEPHEKKWTKDHPLHKTIGDPKSSVRTRGQLANPCLFSCLLSFIEPANVAEALRDVDWVSAMQEELDQFARLKVWRLVPRPEGKSVIKTKWIFKNKKDESSLVIQNKARLVVVGYSQQEGIDYDETFAPVVRIKAIRLFLAYAAHKDFTVFKWTLRRRFLMEFIRRKCMLVNLQVFLASNIQIMSMLLTKLCMV